MPDQNSDMILQISIDSAKTVSQVHDLAQAVKKELGQGIDIGVNFNVNTGASKQQMEKLTKELEEMTKALAAAETKVKELEKTTQEKAKALEGVMKGAAETIGKSFEKGADEAEKAIKEIVATAKSAASGNVFERMFGEQAKTAEAATKQIQKLAHELKKLKEEERRATNPAAQRSIHEDVSAAEARLKSFTQRFRSAFAPVRQEGGDPAAAARALYNIEQQRRAAEQQLRELQSKAAQLHKQMQESAGGGGGGGGKRPTATGGTGGGEPFRLNIDVPHLIMQIEKAFVPTYKLNLDIAHIEGQLQSLKLGAQVVAAGSPTEGAAGPGGRIPDAVRRRNVAIRQQTRVDLLNNAYGYITERVPGAAQHLDALQNLTGPNVNRAAMTPEQLRVHRQQGEAALFALHQELAKSGLNPAQAQEVGVYLNQQYGSPFRRVGAAINQRGMNANERLGRYYRDFSASKDRFDTISSAYNATANGSSEREKLRASMEAALGQYARSVGGMLRNGIGPQDELGALKVKLKAIADEMSARRKMTDYEIEVSNEHRARMKQQAAEDKKYYKEVADAQMRYLKEEEAAEKKYQQETSAYWMRRYKEEGRFANGRVPSSAGYGSTLRNILAIAGGVGIGYSAYNMIGGAMRSQLQYGQEIANLQGVMGSRNPNDAANLSSGIGSVAAKYGMDLVEAAKAAQLFVRADKDATEVVKDLDRAMAASKALGLSIEQVGELQVAVKEVTADNDKYNQSIDYTSAVLDKISAVQSHYAVGAQDMAQAIKILTPLIDNFTNGLGGMNDTFDYTIALTTVVAEKLRITGIQAANSLKLLFSRITTPQTLNKLQQQYGVKVGNSETGDYLPVDRLIGELGHTYATLAPDKQKQFVEQLGGSRNINSVTALLEDYAKVQEVATTASNSFGDSQKRAAISMDTLESRLNQLKVGFTLFTKNAMESTHEFEGLKAIISGLAGLMSAVGLASGKGGLFGTIGLVLSGGALYSGGKALYTMLAEVAKASTVASGATASLFSNLARIFTPGGIILGGVLLLVGGLGLIVSKVHEANEQAERYKVTLRNIQDLTGSPQIAVFKTTASNVGLGSPNAAQSTVSRILSVDNRSAFAPIEADLQRFSAMSDAEFQKFYTKHPEALRKFQQEFTKIFIDQLPDEAKKSFGAMKTEGEKIDAVMKLVGGSSVTAITQMHSAIDDLSAATQRMMDDTLKKLAEFEKAKRDPSLLDKIFGGPNLYDKVPSFIGGSSPESAARQLGAELYERTLQTPAYATIFGDKILSKFALGNIATPEHLARLRDGNTQDTYAKYANDALALINSNPKMSERYSNLRLLQTGDWHALAQLSTAQLADLHPSLDQQEQIRSQKLFEAAQQNAANLGKTYIESHNQNPKRTAEMDRALRRAGSGGTATTLAVPVSGVNEALVHFKDVLLDTARQIYEAVRKFNFEQAYAKRFGQAYDLGGAQIGLGRTFLNMADDFDSSHAFDIVGLRRQIAHLDAVSTVGPDGKRIPKTGVKGSELEREIANLQQEIGDFSGANLSTIFGDSKEGKDLAVRFQSALKKAQLGDYGELKGFGDYLRRAGAGLTYSGLGNQFSDSSAMQSASLRQTVAGYQGQLGMAEVGNDDPLIKRLRAQSEAARRQYEAEAESLAVRRSIGNMDENAYKLAKEKLDTEYQINQIFQDRLAITQEQQKYDDQARANIGNMLMGFKKTLSDTSIWEDVVFPKSTDMHKRWKESAIALRNILFDTVTPLFKTINDRIMENIFQKIVYNLGEMGPLKDIVNTGEYVLKGNIDGAQIHYNAMMSAFTSGAELHYKAIVAAMTGAPMPSAPATGMLIGGLGLGDAGTGNGGISDATVSGMSVPGGKLSTLQMAAVGAGTMVGQLGGTLIGKGGQHAQQGAAIGASIGMIAGSMTPLGPIGGAIGSALGGMLGGLFGGKHDDHQRVSEDPVVKGLDAIERAQRDTITTINAQTDALLKPENRFLNLPSNFNVPGYAPGGMGGTYRVEVAVTVDGSAPATMHEPIASKVAQTVQDSMAEMLYNQRRNQSRS